MRKNPTIRMKSKETAAEVFELFLLTKRADGVKPRTIETYKQHFHAISKHLDINQEIAETTAADLKNMIVSMLDRGLAPNSIKSYTITLKAFKSGVLEKPILEVNVSLTLGVISAIDTLELITYDYVDANGKHVTLEELLLRLRILKIRAFPPAG